MKALKSIFDSNPQNPFVNLPSELQSMILTHDILDIEDIIVISVANKYFYQFLNILSNPKSFANFLNNRKFKVFHNNPKIQNQHFEWIKSLSTDLTKIYLNAGEIYVNSLKKGNLHERMFCEARSETYNEIALLKMILCQNIREIHIDFTGCGGIKWLASFPSLKSLAVENISEWAILHLKDLTNLESMQWKKIDKEEVNNLEMLTSLTSLKVKNITYSGTENLTKLTHLKSLKFKNIVEKFPDVADASVAFLTRLTFLQNLSIKGIALEKEQIPLLKKFSSLINLRSEDLRKVTQ